jgi:hypothetical protein
MNVKLPIILCDYFVSLMEEHNLMNMAQEG